MTHYLSCLSINRLRLPVHLGVGEGERERPQAVEVTARFYFPQLPVCAQDDESSTFICYDSISSSLLDYVQGKEFRFIEYLCMDMYRVIRTHLDETLGEEEAQAIRVWVKLHKCAAPVPYALDGAHFIFSDLPAGASLPAAE